MAIKQTNNIYAKFNPKLNISFVSAENVKEYQALGYQFVMHKSPDVDLLLKLTPQERATLELLLLGKEPKEIASLLSFHVDTIRQFLSSIREKFKCRNNLALVIKIKSEGLDFYLSGNQVF